MSYNISAASADVVPLPLKYIKKKIPKSYKTNKGHKNVIKIKLGIINCTNKKKLQCEDKLKIEFAQKNQPSVKNTTKNIGKISSKEDTSFSDSTVN